MLRNFQSLRNFCASKLLYHSDLLPRKIIDRVVYSKIKDEYFFLPRSFDSFHAIKNGWVMRSNLT